MLLLQQSIRMIKKNNDHLKVLAVKLCYRKIQLSYGFFPHFHLPFDHPVELCKSPKVAHERDSAGDSCFIRSLLFLFFVEFSPLLFTSNQIHRSHSTKNVRTTVANAIFLLKITNVLFFSVGLVRKYQCQCCCQCSYFLYKLNYIFSTNDSTKFTAFIMHMLLHVVF